MGWRTWQKGLWLVRVGYALFLSGICAWLGLLMNLLASPLLPVWAAEESSQAEESPEKEAEEARRAMETFLREQLVLVRRGDLALELDTFYSNDTHDGFIRTNTGVAFAKLTTTVASSIFIIRYGLLDGLELDLDIPFGYTEQVLDLGVSRSTREDFGLGDIAGQLRYQLFYERGIRPSVILDLGAKSITAGSNTLTLLGTGNWNVIGGVTLVKTLDPVVFFGRLGYTATLEREGRNPGDQVSYLLGMGFSLNDRVSFNMRVSGAVVGPLEVNGREISGSSLDIINLQFLVTTRATRRLFIEPLVSVGLTDDAPDVVAGINFIYQFWGR
jgi:hypothetical protein